MTPSKILFWLCGSFILGITLASFLKIPFALLWGFLVAAIGSIIVFALLRRPTIVVIGFCLLFLVLGITRTQIAKKHIINDPLRKLNDTTETITLTGIVVDEPDIRDSFQKLKIKVKNTGSTILVSLDARSTYHYLDTVRVTGALKTPETFSTPAGKDFNYKNHLAKDGIYSVMDFPESELILAKHTHTMFTFLYEKILFMKEKLITSIKASLPSPHGIILEGMVFGNDNNVPKELKEQFNVTGLSHVTAVSGANIVILVNVLMIFLLALGFWRGQAFYIAVILIWVYVALIGLPASGVRAAIMGIIALLAQKLGRQNASARVLVLVAVLMLAQNPLLLRFDVGFQLSFLASLGIIHIKPIIDVFLESGIHRFAGKYPVPSLAPFASKQGGIEKLKTIAIKHLKTLRDLFSVTIAAQIITLPIIVYDFGRISLVAPITNVLALPVVEGLTILGFLLAAAGIFSKILGIIFAVPCWFLLAYFIKILDIFSKPWAATTITNVSWAWVVLFYALLAIALYYFNKKLKPKFLGS